MAVEIVGHVIGGWIITRGLRCKIGPKGVRTRSLCAIHELKWRSELAWNAGVGRHSVKSNCVDAVGRLSKCCCAAEFIVSDRNGLA